MPDQSLSYTITAYNEMNEGIPDHDKNNKVKLQTLTLITWPIIDLPRPRPSSDDGLGHEHNDLRDKNLKCSNCHVWPDMEYCFSLTQSNFANFALYNPF